MVNTRGLNVFVYNPFQNVINKFRAAKAKASAKLRKKASEARKEQKAWDDDEEWCDSREDEDDDDDDEARSSPSACWPTLVTMMPWSPRSPYHVRLVTVIYACLSAAGAVVSRESARARAARARDGHTCTDALQGKIEELAMASRIFEKELWF